MCDSNVDKMAMFLGFVPGSSRNGSHVDNVLNEETFNTLQQTEVEIALCSEVKADVKNLQSEMESLKEIVASLREKSNPQKAKGKGRRQRIPVGLSVSKLSGVQYLE